MCPSPVFTTPHICPLRPTNNSGINQSCGQQWHEWLHVCLRRVGGDGALLSSASLGRVKTKPVSEERPSALRDLAPGSVLSDGLSAWYRLLAWKKNEVVGILTKEVNPVLRWRKETRWLRQAFRSQMTRSKLTSVDEELCFTVTGLHPPGPWVCFVCTVRLVSPVCNC